MAILGEMAELGAESDRYHAEVGALLAELGIELVVGVGEPARAYLARADGYLVEDAASVDRIVAGLRPGRRDPRQGVAVGGARRHPRADRETRTGMVRVLVAGLVAMVIAVVVGPTFIDWLRRQSIGQQIREEMPAGHAIKQGTPTMGGLLILVAALVPALVVSLYTIPGVTILLATLACALIGFSDDYLKQRRRRSLGLKGRWKMLGLVLITAGVAWATTRIGYMDTEIYFPLVDVNIDLGWAYYPFLFLVIAGTSNARQPHGRDRRPRGRNVCDLADHASRDRVDRLDPLRRYRRRTERGVPRHRDRRGGADRGRDRVPLVQRVPG